MAIQFPYQVSISYTLRSLRYSPDKILKVKVTTARSKVKSRSHYDVAHLQSTTSVPTKYQLPTPYSFLHIARTRFYRSRSLQQGQRSNQGDIMMFAHLHPLTNVPSRYQLPTPYGFRDIAQIRFYRSRSLRQGQRSNQGQAMMLHTCTPYPMSLPNINFLHLTVSEI